MSCVSCGYALRDPRCSECGDDQGVGQAPSSLRAVIKMFLVSLAICLSPYPFHALRYLDGPLILIGGSQLLSVIAFVTPLLALLVILQLEKRQAGSRTSRVDDPEAPA